MQNPPKLLIIDDNKEVLTSLHTFFAGKDYDIVAASNGLDALKLLEDKSIAFDLIITDIVMPVVSGVAVISVTKKKFPEIPVIAITGWGEHPEALAAEANADMVLEKPFDLHELEKIVSRILAQKQAVQ